MDNRLLGHEPGVLVNYRVGDPFKEVGPCIGRQVVANEDRLATQDHLTQSLYDALPSSADAVKSDEIFLPTQDAKRFSVTLARVLGDLHYR